MKIAIIGPYPPPYGGISIHVQRLALKLNEDNIDIDIFRNMTVRRWVVKNLWHWGDYDITHFHDTRWSDRFLIGCITKIGIKSILTIHGDSLKNQLQTLAPIKKSLLIFGLKNIWHIIGVKPEIKDILITNGINSDRVSVINAYLPPETNPQDYDMLPTGVRNFIDTHSPIIMQSAFRVLPSDGYDLYGLDLSVRLCSALIDQYPKIGLLIFIADICDQIHNHRLQQRIYDERLEDNILLVFGERLTPALQKADLFLRPTYNDGYSVSVAEAIELGVPTVASDVSVRTSGTVLFKTGDLHDFTMKVSEVLSHGPTQHNPASKREADDTYQKLLNVYKLSSKLYST